MRKIFKSLMLFALVLQSLADANGDAVGELESDEVCMLQQQTNVHRHSTSGGTETVHAVDQEQGQLHNTSLEEEEGLKTFCWRDTVPRGIGLLASTCKANQDQLGLLCYDKCPSDKPKRIGLDCFQNCPDGWRDDGLFCRKAEYGRGVGYFTKRHCTKKHTACEKYLFLWYPKCATGYYPFGCCICRPNKFKCSDHGLGWQLDLSCAKKKITMSLAPKLMSCGGAAPIMQAGLCYKPCPAGEFDGVGPVCWARAPPGWKNCGMGASPSTFGTCASKVSTQVFSVVTAAANLAALIASSVVSVGVAGGQIAVKVLAEITKAVGHVKTAWDVLMQGAHTVNWVGKTFTDSDGNEEDVPKIDKLIDGVSNAVTTEELVRNCADLVSALDPIGLASIVSAYTYPKCSKLFGSYFLPDEGSTES